MKIENRWPEFLTFFLLFVGFIISVFLRNSLLLYLSAIIIGLVTGRVYYMKRFKEPILPFLIIILGFIIGFMIGSFSGSRIIIFHLLIVSIISSYYTYKKEIIGNFKSDDFII